MTRRWINLQTAQCTDSVLVVTKLNPSSHGADNGLGAAESSSQWVGCPWALERSRMWCWYHF